MSPQWEDTLLNRMVDHIRAHGFSAHSYSGQIEACMVGTDASGQAFETWEVLPVDWAAVRRWLGY